MSDHNKYEEFMFGWDPPPMDPKALACMMFASMMALRRVEREMQIVHDREIYELKSDLGYKRKAIEDRDQKIKSLEEALANKSKEGKT